MRRALAVQSLPVIAADLRWCLTNEVSFGQTSAACLQGLMLIATQPASGHPGIGQKQGF
jgi:hypothetical protein